MNTDFNVEKNQIPIQIGGAKLGYQRLADVDSKSRRFDVAPHQVFDSIFAELCNVSALLQLAQEATKQQIEKAYGDDVKMISTRVAEFESMIGRMILCGIKLWQLELQPNISLEEERKKAILDFLWKRLQSDLPSDKLMAKAVLWISAEEHMLGDSELLKLLKERVKDGLLRQVKVWNSYFNTLVEKNLLGAVQWMSDSVCKYHYFTHEGMRNLLVLQKFEKMEDGWAKGFEQEVNQYDTFHVRIEHHLTNAKAYSIKEFPQTMPQFAAEFLDETSEWIKPYIKIVGGTLTQENICRQQIGSMIVVEEPKMVYMNDPAITFGNLFTLPIGWVKDGYESTANDQDLRSKNRKATIVRAIGIISLIGVIIALLVIGLNYATKQNNKAEMSAYNAYMNKHKGSKQYKIAINQRFVLPKPFDKMDWRLGSIGLNGYGNKNLTIQLSDPSGSYISDGLILHHNTSSDPDIYCDPLGKYYGDIDVSTISFNTLDSTSSVRRKWREFPAANKITMHLLNVTESEITYALSVEPMKK